MKQILWITGLLLCCPCWSLMGQNANTFRTLSQERESLQCRMDLMRQAKKEILLSTYAIKPDVIGLATLQLLIEAAQRGVSVQLLIDDFGSELSACLLLYLEEQGVHTKVFNIINVFEFRTVVDRMHGKMLITDRKNLIVGGRNLKEDYYTLDTLSNFLDREVYVVSDSAVQQAMRHFNTLWNNPKVSRRKPATLTAAQRICWKAALDQAPEIVQKRLHLAPFGQRNWQAGVKNAAAPVHFIHDNFSYKQRKRHRWRTRKDRQATKELIALVSGAQRTIELENAYFIPTRRWRIAFKKCLDRGVKIRLITNSSYSTDVPFIEAIYLSKRARALRNGIEIWEYHGTKMLHTKAMVIDGHISLIGSYNLERQSHKFNSEVAAWVDDPLLAVENTRLMNYTRDRSVQIGAPRSTPKVQTPPSKIQRKRHRKVQFLRFTLAPLAGFIL